MGWMDEEKSVFEQLTLRNCKKWTSTALKDLNNYIVIMTNNSDNMATYGCHDCDVDVSPAYFWVNSIGCSGELRDDFKRFQNLKNLVSRLMDMIKFWYKFQIEIYWYNFTRDHSFY